MKWASEEAPNHILPTTYINISNHFKSTSRPGLESVLDHIWHWTAALSTHPSQKVEQAIPLQEVYPCTLAKRWPPYPSLHPASGAAIPGSCHESKPRGGQRIQTRCQTYYIICTIILKSCVLSIAIQLLPNIIYQNHAKSSAQVAWPYFHTGPRLHETNKNLQTSQSSVCMRLLTLWFMFAKSRSMMSK